LVPDVLGKWTTLREVVKWRNSELAKRRTGEVAKWRNGEMETSSVPLYLYVSKKLCFSLVSALFFSVLKRKSLRLSRSMKQNLRKRRIVIHRYNRIGILYYNIFVEKVKITAE